MIDLAKARLKVGRVLSELGSGKTVDRGKDRENGLRARTNVCIAFTAEESRKRRGRFLTKEGKTIQGGLNER